VYGKNEYLYVSLEVCIKKKKNKGLAQKLPVISPLKLNGVNTTK
jgi:hypothetical protein